MFKLRILLADMRTWQTHNELSNKSKLKNFLINIHIQLNRLIEIQYDILNVMHQKINFPSVFMKQLDSNEFENESEIDVNDEKNVFMTEQIERNICWKWYHRLIVRTQSQREHFKVNKSFFRTLRFRKK